MTFGQKLSSLRKQANLTQSDLAEKISVSRQAIAKWESDKGLPDIENIKKISSIFKKAIDELLDYKFETIKLDEYINEKKINRKNFKIENIHKFILDKFSKADTIYWLYVERYVSFWKSLFDIDVFYFIHDIIDLFERGGTVAYLIETNKKQQIVLVNIDMIRIIDLDVKFDKKSLILDGFKYTKIEKNKIK